MLNYALRVNLTIAIVEMTGIKHTDHHTIETLNKTLNNATVEDSTAAVSLDGNATKLVSAQL